MDSGINIAEGVAHKVPEDLKKTLQADPLARTAWNDLTPLARNEWICWITFVKKEETRKEHAKRAIKELKEGKRRPCCWLGCTHRIDKPMSASQKYILGKHLKESGDN